MGGVSYRTAWLVHDKLMTIMAACDATLRLEGDVQIDDAYLGGELPCTRGLGSANKVVFVAAVSLNDKGYSLHAKMSALPGFTRKAVAERARCNLQSGTDVSSDGQACFAGVIDAGCAHSFIVVGPRKPREMPQFKWVDTVLGNLKTTINGACKAFRFGKYTTACFGGFCYRFNHWFDLYGLVTDLIRDASRARPRKETQIRRPAELHA